MSKLETRVKNLANPDIQTLEVILLDELCGRLEDLTEKLSSFNTYAGPMTRMFPREQQYQYATVPAGAHARVYYLRNPQPDLLTGIIMQVGNSWFPRTYLEWLVDYEPKRVQYVIADVHIPKEYERGIPFEQEVEWIAYNDDWTATATYNPTIGHTFEVLNDGYFIDKKLYNKIIGE